MPMPAMAILANSAQVRNIVCCKPTMNTSSSPFLSFSSSSLSLLSHLASSPSFYALFANLTLSPRSLYVRYISNAYMSPCRLRHRICVKCFLVTCCREVCCWGHRCWGRQRGGRSCSQHGA